MSTLQAIRGRIVDLRRYTNVHLYWRGRLGPTDRYELWMRDRADHEHKFTINTRTLLARRGHQITVIVDAEQVRGMINWTTEKVINYVRIDPSPLLRMGDLLVPPAIFAGLVTLLGDLGLLLFLPTVVTYFLLVVIFRGIARGACARNIDQALSNAEDAHLARQRSVLR